MKRYYLLLLILLPLFSAFAQRGVLLEKYTSAWCGLCPDAHLQVQALTETYPTLIPVLHHSSVDGMGNPFSSEWFQGFNVPGTPRGMVDRWGSQANNIAVMPSVWQSRIQQRLAETAVVELELSGRYDADARRMEIDVQSVFSETPPAGHLHLNVMIVEDSVIGSGGGWDQSSYFNEASGHPLEGLGNPLYNYPHRHVLRAVLDGTWGTPDAFPDTVTPGQSYSRSYTYDIPNDFRPSQLQAVVFVSLFHPTDLTRREVLNARAIDLTELDYLSAQEEPLEAAELQLFPNPTSGELFIRVSPGVAANNPVLALFDAAGQRLQTVTPRASDQRLDLSAYPAGLYLLRLYTDSGTIDRKVILHTR